MNFLNCTLYLVILGIVSFIIGRLLPASWFHETDFPFKSFSWEKSGTVYHKLGVRKWQNRVPDMSKIFPDIMQEKKISHNFQEELPIMIKETCIAEFIHVLLCIAGFYCIRIWNGAGGIWVSVLYCLGNLPYIIIQRFNRPRLLGLREKVITRALKGEEAENGNLGIKLQHRTGA